MLKAGKPLLEPAGLPFPVGVHALAWDRESVVLPTTTDSVLVSPRSMPFASTTSNRVSKKNGLGHSLESLTSRTTVIFYQRRNLGGTYLTFLRAGSTTFSPATPS